MLRRTRHISRDPVNALLTIALERASAGKKTFLQIRKRSRPNAIQKGPEFLHEPAMDWTTKMETGLKVAKGSFRQRLPLYLTLRIRRSVIRFLVAWKRRGSLPGRRSVWTIAWAILLATSNPAYAVQADIGKFAGAYIGEYVSEPAGSVQPDDLHLRVRTHRKGFMLDWQSLARSEAGAKHHHNVSFAPTHRPNIYIAAMRCDMFGNLRPLDPMHGEPFMWASVEGDRINLHVMAIDKRGAHDLRIYRYRLEGEKMTLAFERFRDEECLRVIRGGMKKLPAGANPAGPPPGAIIEEHGAPECG